MGRVGRVGFCVVILTMGVVARGGTQVTRLQSDLFYEAQRVASSVAGEEVRYSRNAYGVALKIEGYIYNPRLISLIARFYLQREQWKDQPLLGDLASVRRSPYDIQVELLKTRPVAFSFQAYRRLFRNETSAYRYDRWERTWMVGHSLSLPGLPKVRLTYARTVFTLDSVFVRRSFRRNRFTAKIQQRVHRFRYEFDARYEDYDVPTRWDSLRLEGRFKYVAPPGGVPFETVLALQKWGDLLTWTGRFHRTSERRRLYVRWVSTSTGEYRRSEGTLRYEWFLTDNLRLNLEPGGYDQRVGGETYREAYLQPSLVVSRELGRWNMVLTPRVKVSFHRGEGQSELGYGIGLQGALERTFKIGRIRGQVGANYDMRPIMPEFRNRGISLGLIWSKNIPFVQFELFTLHRFEHAVSSALTSRIYYNDTGIRFAFPRLRVRILTQMADMVWNDVPYRRRFVEVSLGPLYLGPLRGQLFQRVEYVNGTYYTIGRGRLRWPIGQFRIELVGSLYSTIQAVRDKSWWDVRLVIRRPLQII